MASDPEAKRLEDWKTASKTYCARLEDMAARLSDKIETVPATHILKGLAKTSIEIERASKSFRDAVNRAEGSAPKPPEPPSKYGF